MIYAEIHGLDKDGNSIYFETADQTLIKIFKDRIAIEDQKGISI